MLTAQYIEDHVRYIDSLPPEFGRNLARLILAQAVKSADNHKNLETFTFALDVTVTEIKLSTCIDISVNGVHVGHIGV